MPTRRAAGTASNWCRPPSRSSAHAPSGGQYTAGTDIVFALSGLWSCEPDADAARRRDRLQLVPAAVAQLCARAEWRDSTQQMLEWLCHTRDARPSPSLAAAAHRAALALRHTEPFAHHRVWTRMETYFGHHMDTDE
ncbi:uncharacterized protein [Choristoneura fumiferana]|uniref:uncharacterized protein n=1 Tax=Choristoneura fumiferana TaxID=7141 RepID=UPI003D1582F9